MLNQIFLRSKLVLTILVFLLTTGILSYIAIPKENKPDIQIPFFYISLSLDGVAPGDAEQLLVKPIEAELSNITGIKKITTKAYQGGGNVLLEFDAGYDLQKAYSDIKKGVDFAKPDLPDEAKEPFIVEINISDTPVIVMALSGDVPTTVLVKTARELEKKLRQIPEVLDVTIQGDREESVEVTLKPEVLEAYNISPSQVVSLFRSSNKLIIAGEQSDKQFGEFAIKVPGTFKNIEDVVNLPVVSKGDKQILIKDLVTYKIKYKKARVITKYNGAPSITLEISKRTGQNLLLTIQKIKALSEIAKPLLPKGLKIDLTSDTSDKIDESLSNLQNSILSAIALIMIVVVAVLGLRSGILIGISIPTTFFSGIVVLYTLGISMNTVVLFGLVLSIGMLVDGTIVITEYAERKRGEGFEIEQSYKMAVKTMAAPIISSTATTLAVFIPLMFWPGLIGKFMRFLPLTLIAILSASLIVALIIIPVLGTHFKKFFSFVIKTLIPLLATYIAYSIFGKLGFIALPISFVFAFKLAKRYDIASAKPIHSSDEKSTYTLLATAPISDFESLKGINKKYFSLLKLALAKPRAILIGTGVLLLTSWGAYIGFGAGVTFFPQSEPSLFDINVYSPGNLSLSEKIILADKVEKVVVDFNQKNKEFMSYTAITGSVSGTQAIRQDKISQISIELADWQQRRTYNEIKSELSQKLNALKGIEIRFTSAASGPASSKPIELIFEGKDRQALKNSTTRIKNYMLKKGIFSDIDDTLTTEGLDFAIEPNRLKAAAVGVSVNDIGQAIQLITSGVKVGTFRPDFTDEEVDVYLKYPKEYRTITGLRNLKIQAPNGTVPILDIASIKPIAKTTILRRRNSKTNETLNASVKDGVIANTALKELVADIESKKLLDDGVNLVLGGDNESQAQAMQFLIKAFAIAIFIMAVILLTQFNSFFATMLVLLTVILSTIGVMLGLLALHQPFSIVMSGIGIISLAGIVVNNNIVLIDEFQRLQKIEKNTYDAIVRTCLSRLRPILLTSGTTWLGLFPTALGISIDFVTREITFNAPSGQIWQVLSQNILFGLTFSSILTLIITPCALYVFYRNKNVEPAVHKKNKTTNKTFTQKPNEQISNPTDPSNIIPGRNF